MTLTSKQRAFLNSQAHSLKPIIQIGKNGLNDQIKTSLGSPTGFVLSRIRLRCGLEGRGLIAKAF